jgi:hypothetical protein
MELKTKLANTQDRLLTITEGSRITKLYMIQGLDFTVEQKSKGQQAAYLSHYSNPGNRFFSVLLKFLHETNAALPAITKPTGEIYDEFRNDARFFAADAATAKFPMGYQYYYDISGQGNPPMVDFKIINQGSKSPELEATNSDGKKLIISQEVARVILERMPKMYPTFDSFYLAYQAFIEETEKLSALKRR